MSVIRITAGHLTELDKIHAELVSDEINNVIDYCNTLEQRLAVLERDNEIQAKLIQGLCEQMSLPEGLEKMTVQCTCHTNSTTLCPIHKKFNSMTTH